MSGQQPRKLSSESSTCPFCRIVADADPQANVVGRGRDWVAFLPLEPATRGHTLVVPRMHVRNFWEASPALAADMAAACLRVGNALRELLSPEGMNLITSAGEAAEQTVFHLHIHVVPRWHGDAIGALWPSAAEGGDPVSPDLVRSLRQVIARHGAL